MKIHIVMLAVILVGLWSAPGRSAAQTEDEWSIIIYDHGLNALVELSPSDIGVIPLPEMGYPPRPVNNQAPGGYEVSQVKLTDNHRYLVSIIHHTDPPGDWAEVVFDSEGMVTLAGLVVGDVAFDDLTYDRIEPLPLGTRVRVLEGPIPMEHRTM